MSDGAASVLVSKACKCFCSDELVASKGESRAEFDALSELSHPLPTASAADLLAYSTDMGQPLRGSPLREGDVWFLRSEATAEKADDDAEAEQERQSWVMDIARCVQLLTQSLFPPFSISCEPVQSSGVTARRLMAGYVLYHSDVDVSTVLYGELSPHSRDGEEARLAFYENEQCTKLALEIWLAVGSNCFEKVGVNCTCFCINGHDFSARTISERKLWLRAISNMKVKLQNSAPAPTKQDIIHYREAIDEQVRTLECSLEGRAPVEALLQRVTGKSAAEPGQPAVVEAKNISRSGSPLPSERSRADDRVPPTPDTQDSRPSSAAWTLSRPQPTELVGEPAAVTLGL